jgi:hypothetical protein
VRRARRRLIAALIAFAAAWTAFFVWLYEDVIARLL